ncbi:hypothetical protein FA95DRAFT_853749 [Auriscalpium vulgare]|uniref:Uncharacterized protein n=1 Tax=Auriscalpium vulgare TaxID=40419 RepID=A0ACB8R9J4_9AGAM|nr:hypothetical protein FA95DRAFT_853749 [Auriscalpium vulgare]
MCQCHQAFVIARVRPHGGASLKYRCIAAYDYRWCYGTLPLRAAQRFITLIKQEDNATLVRAEVAAMHGKYGRWNGVPRMPELPAGAVALMLATSWAVALEAEDVYTSGYSYEENVLGADTDMDGACRSPPLACRALTNGPAGDNDDGVTIIDVTDPTAPQCCFTRNINGPPLSALEYVRNYYTISDAVLAGEADVSAEDCPQDIVTLIKAMDDIPMVTADMLHQVWPSKYRQFKYSADNYVFAEELSATLPSMREFALRSAVANALEYGDTSGLEGWMWQPEMVTVARAALRERQPFPDTGVPLLQAIITQDRNTDPTVVDLTGFALSSAQIVQIIVDGADLRTVTLSDNAVVDIAAVKHVLTAAPNVARLVLLACPAITDDALIALLDSEPALFYRIGALLHPVLFLSERVPESSSAPYANAFSLVLYSTKQDVSTTYRTHVHAFSRPYFTPEGIVDMLEVLLGAVWRMRTDHYGLSSLMDSAFVAQCALSAAPLLKEQAWSRRSIALVPRSSLCVRRGEGWCFLARFNENFMPRGKNMYGFVRFFPKGEKGAVAVGEVLDLRGFVARMVAEGRPAPPEEKTASLERHITALGDSKYSLSLMTQTDITAFQKRQGKPGLVNDTTQADEGS